MNNQPKLTEMITNQPFEGYLMVRSAVQKTGSNGGKYLDMSLCDISGNVNAKKWDSTPAPAVGSIVKVTGKMLEYNGHPQLRVDKLLPVTEKDDIDMSVIAPCAPYPAEQMRAELDERARAIKDKALRELVIARLEICGEELNYYPAASKLHHAERSGLLHHTTTMLKMAGFVCTVYPQLDPDLLAAGVILHDLCKLDEMLSDPAGVVSDYTARGNLIGHLVAGVAEIDRIGRELGTPAELLMMVEHMIISHHDLPEFGSPKPPMFPEAEVLHTLDLLDARMFEMDRELKSAIPGGFTERIWSLERKLYRRKNIPSDRKNVE